MIGWFELENIWEDAPVGTQVGPEMGRNGIEESRNNTGSSQDREGIIALYINDDVIIFGFFLVVLSDVCSSFQNNCI